MEGSWGVRGRGVGVCKQGQFELLISIATIWSRESEYGEETRAKADLANLPSFQNPQKH